VPAAGNIDKGRLRLEVGCDAAVTDAVAVSACASVGSLGWGMPSGRLEAVPGGRCVPHPFRAEKGMRIHHAAGMLCAAVPED
jgi:hypothetical protein